MMKELLYVNYNIYATDHVSINGRVGFRDHDYNYFIISASNKEMVLLEQAALAYYLAENGYNHTAIPIPTTSNNWFSEKDGQYYLVLRVSDLHHAPPETHGKKLAQFHHLTASYQYEPQEISSYGMWKDLWIRKLTAFEHKLSEEKKDNENRNAYYRLLVDVFPYIIGISENAIQYMQESETERRYHQRDTGVFAFRRYRDHLLTPVIWTDDLVYDHPTRDIAEYIRYKLLDENQSALDEVAVFMKEYQAIQPLSIFGWRLLYARLLFPIHLFDLMENGFQEKNDEKHAIELEGMLQRQIMYEKRLNKLFQVLQVNFREYDIPVLHWLEKG
jgi:spore coat protein YutH